MATKTFEQVQANFRAELENMAMEYGCCEDEIAHDLVVATCSSLDDKALAFELCRVELGWVPDEVKGWYA